MERMQQRIRQIAGGDQAKLARLKEILTWFDNEWEISRTVRAMAMYAKERDDGDVLLGGSHAAVLQVHRVAPLGDGADRFAQGESQAEVVVVQVEGRAPRG